MARGDAGPIPPPPDPLTREQLDALEGDGGRLLMAQAEQRAAMMAPGPRRRRAMSSTSDMSTVEVLIPAGTDHPITGETLGRATLVTVPVGTTRAERTLTPRELAGRRNAIRRRLAAAEGGGG